MPAFLPVSTWDREFLASLREHYSASDGPPPWEEDRLEDRRGR